MSLEKAYLDEFCRKLEEMGWERLEPQKFENVLLLDVFKKKIKEINAQIFKEYDESKIFHQLFSLLQNADEVKTLDMLKYGVTVIIKKWNSLIPINIKLIDYENPENNQFNYIIDQEFTFGNTTRRPDITLFVNGIPIVILEGKNPLKPTIEKQYLEALKQIIRYQKEIPNLFKYVQFGIGVGEENPYMPTLPTREIKNPSNYMFWKVNGKEDIFFILHPTTLLEIVRYFIFFTIDKKGERTKIMARYMQYFATQKAIKRISQYIENKENKNKGLIWHWQGSGKTYTMFFIANKFLHIYQKKNPLVFFVIDRLDLQKQLDEVIKSIENKKLGDIKQITTIEELNKIIENADKEWGLRIVTMQKFQPTKINIKEIDRKEILFLIDEAHRTQYGDLASTMRRIFSKGIFIGFSGTPIFKKERNTFKHFSYPPEELYLDVYFITQSQEDGFTLPITYRLIEEKDVDILLNEEEIKEIIKIYDKDEEIAESIIAGELAKKIKSQMRRKLTHIKIFLTSEKRIEKVVEYIKNHIEEDTENFKFKAMIVAANREACVIYKEKMDKYFYEEFSEVVMSYNPNEENDKIHTFKSNLLKRWSSLSVEEANKKIVEKFIKENNPKVLIVTDMLLTGFDAPILKAMYLDKPMFYHKLLQAIARVNRPYEEKDKKRGLVIDTIGLLYHIQKTLSIYKYLAEENDEKIKEDLKNIFSDSKKDLEILKKNISYLKKILKGDYEIDIESIKNQIKKNDISFREILMDKISYMALLYGKEDKINKLIILLRDTLKLYKSLGGDPYKIDYLWDIKILSIIYYLLWKKIHKSNRKLSKELWDSIIEWIHNSTIIDKLRKKFEKEIEINTMSKPSLYGEVSDYFYTIRNSLIDHLSNPLYKEIYYRLEALRDSWKNRNITIEEFMEKLKDIDKKVNEYLNIEKKPLWIKLSEFTKRYIKKETNRDISIEDLEKKIKEICNRKRFLERDKKEINLIIAKTLLKANIPTNERIKIEKEIMEMIITEMRSKI